MTLWAKMSAFFTKKIDEFLEWTDPSSIPEWIEIAESQLGIAEIVGPKTNAKIQQYHNETSLKASSDEVPWCSSFVNWVMKQAGIKGTNSAAARSWVNWGDALNAPRIGAISVLSRGSNPALGHVGFFMGFANGGKSISVLGGNQGDRVSIQDFPASRVVAYRWPAGES